jgi:hypothetical protein
MSEEFSNGVKIILSRVESNPEEFRGEYSPWKELMHTVLNYKINPTKASTFSIQALTYAEIDALHDAFFPLARQGFDEWVMKTVFSEKESDMPVQAQLFAQAAKRIPSPWTDPRLFQNVASPSTISLQGDTVVQGTLDANPSPALLAKIKKGLGL